LEGRDNVGTNMKMDIKEITFGNENWIEPVQNCVQWQGLRELLEKLNC
jgi:hypothetical protein